MGETASTWKVPLHSSDTEHEWQKRYASKGKGGAFDIARGERGFIGSEGDPTSGISTAASPANKGRPRIPSR
jgi:hypothetical protein